ncbi:PaaI family thioesterase [Pseudonocardia parietis]|uniref:Uncharacterized protein (TIGR00369 family) n=1 Tax=Pseudonocardia parietis TaxID=570936 RepID=A0ABS4VZM0_9PSEU|nr:hotdog domain-containing protein [Pseudonocardia parietis]MBP2369366.1 uncharacterized protein (TIGR00369 family) [Pseudonocardia parietis]
MTGTTAPSSTHRPGPSTRERMRWAPVETGLGMEPDPSSSRDRTRLRAPLHDGVRTGDGRVLTVLPALLADSGIGYLVYSTARLDAGAPTLDLRIDLAGAPAPDARWLVAELTLLHLDDEIGVGRAEMRDDTGVLVAHAVVTMALTAVPDRPGGLARPGGSIDPDAAPRTDGTGSTDGADFRSTLPPFDPARLAPENLEIDDATGDAVFTPGPSTVNLNGTTHGAVLSGLAQSAQASHLRRAGADQVRPLSLTVDFLRPAHVDTTLRARSEIVRDGRRFWSVRTELLLPDGRPAVRAVGGGLRTAG